MKQVLIVANQTAAGGHLRDEIARRVSQEPHRFTFLVPARPPLGTFTWTEGQARAAAEERLHRATEALSDLAAEIEGVVGVNIPMDAIADVLLTRSFDEIIISTLPHKISHWLRIDLPSRVEHRFGIPVTHIVATRADHHAA